MRTYKPMISVFALIFVFIFFLTTIANTKAKQLSAVIDFEGIPPGTIIDQVYSGYGISGAPVDGFITVVAFTPDSVDVNRAMIFDARCPPGNVPADCSGNDSDLFNPSFGNTLIISEDLDTTDPDDADLPGSRIRFEYINLGQGDGATIESLEIQDIEEDQGELEDARIYFWEGGFTGTIVGTVNIPHTGDGGSALVPVNFTHVDAMGIDLAGSGMINNIRLSAEPTAVELLNFEVDRPLDGQINLSWETAAEIDNLGFYVYRSASMSFDDAERIHFEPTSGGSGGHTYSYTDSPGSGSWWYFLSDIDTYGVETFHLPENQTATYNHTSFLPLLVGK
ncbi:MAG: hypothetical protein JSV69_11685 [Chloroflexota bacterium]|nr:MAG: hypothetical protein JSV69_11685 [Chloroflexota bacterium]